MRISDWSSDVCSSDLVGRLSLRDTRTRWGSCNSKGDLNFSWRLILAPEHVLDYVVAHEVAHMVPLDHSQRFWKLAGPLDPDERGARDWREGERQRVVEGKRVDISVDIGGAAR